MDKIQLLQRLISKATDEEEIKKLNDELLAAIKEQAKAEANQTVEQQVKAAIDKERLELAKKNGMKVGDDGNLEVLANDRYKGISLKGAVASIIAADHIPADLKSRYQADHIQGEKMAKLWIDLIENAKQMPFAAREKAGMTEGSTTGGGYLTPPDQREELWFYTREQSTALKYATRIPMVSDTMDVNAENVKVSVAYSSEANDAADTEPTVAQTRLTTSRMDAYVKVSNELLADAVVAGGGLVGRLLDQFMEAVALKVDSTVFLGTGNPVSGLFVGGAGYSQVFGSTSTNFSALIESDVRAIIAKINPLYLANARWFIHHSPKFNYFYGLKDSYGRPLFVPSMVAGGQDMLWGWPVVSGSQMPSATSVGGGMALFGDLKGMFIGERLTNIDLFQDPYSLSRSFQTQFLLFTRWAYALVMPNYLGLIMTAGS